MYYEIFCNICFLKGKFVFDSFDTFVLTHT